jgi:acyl-CoA:acyl-CoA alkyltransferase
MFDLKYKHVCIEAMALNIPPLQLTSAEIEDRIAPLYQKLNIPFGTLEKISGVKSRFLWERKVTPSQAATGACKKLLEQSLWDTKDIGALISCSVARDYFEPAVASLVHNALGLREDTISFDITNACIGFSDGLAVVANMIECGAIKSGIVVSGETVTQILEGCIKQLQTAENLTREVLLKILPTLTLGSNAVAYLLTHESISTTKHKLKGIVARSASNHCDLCMGNEDFELAKETAHSPAMITESAKLMAAAAKLGGRTWIDASEAFGWKKDDIDHVFCHQVGKQVNEAFYNEMGLDVKKEFTIYKTFGNPVSAALPTALAIGAEEKPIKKGEKILLTAFGSGLNCRFIAIEW